MEHVNLRYFSRFKLVQFNMKFKNLNNFQQPFRCPRIDDCAEVTAPIF